MSRLKFAPDEIKREFNPPLVMIRNQTVPVEYAVAARLEHYAACIFRIYAGEPSLY